MPGNRKFTVVLLAMIALFASGCLEKKTNKKTTSTSNSISNPWNPYPTPTPTPTGTSGAGTVPTGSDADPSGSTNVQLDCTTSPGTVYCHTISNIVARGSDGPKPQTIAWSSNLWNEKLLLESDGPIYLRVIPRSAPSIKAQVTQPRSDLPSYCEFLPMNPSYTMLSMTVSIKKDASSSPSYTRTFERIPINTPSYPKEFAIPFGVPNGSAPVIEVTNLQWDCPGDYTGQGTCEMQSVFYRDCVAFDLQFSTDYTYKWNRPIKY